MSLGIVLAPYGQLPNSNYPYNITQSRGANGTYLQPYDYQHYEHGEAGYYYDTPLGATHRKLGWLDRWRLKRAMKAMHGLGAIPTDAELSTVRGYSPVESGWISTTNQGFIPPVWNPPNGWLQMGAMGPRVAPRTPLGDASPIVSDNAMLPAGVPMQTTSATDVLAALQAHNDRIFALALVSTSAVAVSALITVFRQLHLIRSEGK